VLPVGVMIVGVDRPSFAWTGRDRAAASAAPFYAQGADNNFGREGRAVGWMPGRIGQFRVEFAGQSGHLRKQLVDIELELAGLIAAERVAGRLLAEPGAGSTAFTLLTNWSFSPFREASGAARTVASRSRRSP
jgi:hypothetical protein